jgi:hypothetical protein
MRKRHLRRLYPDVRVSKAQPIRKLGTYEVYADNELCLAAVVTLNFGQASSVQRVGTLLRRAVSVSVLLLLLLLLLHGVAWRGGCLLLAVHLLLVLRRVSVATAGVDWRWRHGASRPALVRMLLRAEIIALISILVGRWAAERLLLWVHG